MDRYWIAHFCPARRLIFTTPLQLFQTSIKFVIYRDHFKQILADYKFNKNLVNLFFGQPYITVHMNAKERNEYIDFKKKDKKNEQAPILPMKSNFGMNIGYGYPQQPQMMGMGMGMQHGSNMIGQPIGMTSSHLNQPMKIPTQLTPFRQWLLFIFLRYPPNTLICINKHTMRFVNNRWKNI